MNGRLTPPSPPLRSVFDPSLVKFVDLETLDIESHVDLISFPPKYEEKKITYQCHPWNEAIFGTKSHEPNSAESDINQ